MSQPPQPPYSGQPEPHQPGYGQQPPPPSYGPPPAYGPPQPAPGYGQQPPPPGYGQRPPEYGYAPPQPYGPGDQPGPGGVFPPPQPPKGRSKALPIVLIAIGVVLVLCVGGGAAVYLAVRNKTKDVVQAINDAANPTAVPTPTGTGSGTKAQGSSKITVVEPSSLGGRPKLDDPAYGVLAKQLQTGLADVPDATATVAALYGTPSKKDIVIVVAAAAPISDPETALNDIFGGGVSPLQLSDVTTASTGSLGGAAKCGKTDATGSAMVICGWADAGSRGFDIFLGSSSVSSAKSEFPQLREQVEKS